MASSDVCECCEHPRDAHNDHGDPTANGCECWRDGCDCRRYVSPTEAALGLQEAAS